MKLLKQIVALLAISFVATPAHAVSSQPKLKTTNVVIDSDAERRIPVTLVVPASAKCCVKVRGVILFSHGAFSNPGKYSALTERWALAGYAVIAPLHADSEAWPGAKPSQAQSAPWRIGDMKAALDNLATFGKEANLELAGRPIIIAGHSFGGLIAQFVDDERIKGVIAFSPPGQLPGLAVPPVGKPLLTVTGTADVVPMMAPKWEDHLTPHNAATGPATAYIGTGADHYFGRIIGRTEYTVPPQSDQFAEALAVSLLFLRGIADDDESAERDLRRYKPKHGTIQRR